MCSRLRTAMWCRTRRARNRQVLHHKSEVGGCLTQHTPAWLDLLMHCAWAAAWVVKACSAVSKPRRLRLISRTTKPCLSCTSVWHHRRSCSGGEWPSRLLLLLLLLRVQTNESDVHRGAGLQVRNWQRHVQQRLPDPGVLCKGSNLPQPHAASGEQRGSS